MDQAHTQEFWDARYAGDGYRFGEAPNAFLRRRARRFSPGMKVLSVADGEGRNGVWLAEQGAEVLTADISPLAVEKARALAARRGVTIDARVADLETWDWPVGEMDAVVGVFVQYGGWALRDRLFQRMKAALKPGGLILLQGYRPEQLEKGTGGPSDPDAFYTVPLLRAAFADFELLEMDIYEAELDEGVAHAGPSAVIDMVARRPLAGQ